MPTSWHGARGATAKSVAMEQPVVSAPCIARAGRACETLARVRVVRGSGERTVLFGTFADGTDGVAIVDGRTSRLVDGFACYRPTLAPDGRRIAFERYFTRGAHVALRYRGLVAVYDLARTPGENRSRGDDARFPGRVVNPPEMTGDASERWVDAIAWRSASVLRFAVRYDERTHDVTVRFPRRKDR